MLYLLRSWTTCTVIGIVDNQYHLTCVSWAINNAAIMSRIISCGYRSASKLSALSFRSVIVPINGSDAMFCRLMSTNVSNSEMEEKKEQPTGM